MTRASDRQGPARVPHHAPVPLLYRISEMLQAGLSTRDIAEVMQADERAVLTLIRRPK
jgi:hypothetical protein